MNNNKDMITINTLIRDITEKLQELTDIIDPESSEVVNKKIVSEESHNIDQETRNMLAYRELFDKLGKLDDKDRDDIKKSGTMDFLTRQFSSQLKKFMLSAGDYNKSNDQNMDNNDSFLNFKYSFDDIFPPNNYPSQFIKKVASESEKEIDNFIKSFYLNTVDKKPEYIGDLITQVYIDGSYNAKGKTVGYGGIISFPKDKTVKFYGSIAGISELDKMRNVSGEICAMLIAMELCRSYKEIEVYYDYYGIEKWADGSWKRNKIATKKYHKIMKGIMKETKIKFIKIEGHTGDLGNEEADKLAKKGSGII